MSIPQADLVTLCHGASLELFQNALEQVTANIKDPNTSATKKRTISLKVEFVPYPDRSGANVSVGVETKLSSHQGVNGSVFIRRQPGGAYKAYTQDGNPLDMFGGQEELETEDAETPRKPQ